MDTVTASQELKLDYQFADNDTRLTSIPNPRSNITDSDIKAVAATLYDTQAFVGDANNGAFATITSAKIIEKTVTKLDLAD